MSKDSSEYGVMSRLPDGSPGTFSFGEQHQLKGNGILLNSTKEKTQVA